MDGIVNLALGAAAFVGTHFLMSHPLRAPIVGAIGERGFLALYSAVSLATFAWMALAYRAVPPEPLWWPQGDAVWIAASMLTLLAAVLFAGSLFGNPALPDPSGLPRPVPQARGVFAITRHPMMWGFALWAVSHILAYPAPAQAILAGAILFLALVGAWAQDRKKAALQPEFWAQWQARTSYWPFARGLAFGDSRAWIAGVALWLGASWLHQFGAGIWRWIG